MDCEVVIDSCERLVADHAQPQLQRLNSTPALDRIFLARQARPRAESGHLKLENVIDAALRIGDEKRTGYNITIEALVILAESDMTQKARQKMIAEWRRMRLL